MKWVKVTLHSHNQTGWVNLDLVEMLQVDSDNSGTRIQFTQSPDYWADESPEEILGVEREDVLSSPPLDGAWRAWGDE